MVAFGPRKNHAATTTANHNGKAKAKARAADVMASAIAAVDSRQAVAA
jgi:hypothetical protein